MRSWATQLRVSWPSTSAPVAVNTNNPSWEKLSKREHRWTPQDGDYLAQRARIHKAIREICSLWKWCLKRGGQCGLDQKGSRKAGKWLKCPCWCQWLWMDLNENDAPLIWLTLCTAQFVFPALFCVFLATDGAKVQRSSKNVNKCNKRNKCKVQR